MAIRATLKEWSEEEVRRVYKFDNPGMLMEVVERNSSRRSLRDLERTLEFILHHWYGMDRAEIIRRKHI